jgi:hypothetical protein
VIASINTLFPILNIAILKMSSLSYGSIPYYKINQIFWTWTLYDGEDGCHIVRDTALSLDKAPPRLRDQPKTPPLPPKAPAPEKDFLDHLVAAKQAVSRFKKWLDTPDPPKPPRPATQGKKRDTVPPFDIQEIPDAMRATHMPVGAKLMEKWFAGELNYSPDDAAEVAMTNQDGKPYPPSMIDTKTVKMAWILEFARAKQQYELLISIAIYSESSRDKIAQKLAPYGGLGIVDLNAWRECPDLPSLHKRFQFQLSRVNGTLEQKFAMFIADQKRGTPDDLTAALGSFSFYAAIAGARIDRHTMTVTHIAVYVKDNYTFGTKPHEASQYLGHWNRKGVIVVPAFLAAQLGNIEFLDYAVATEPKSVYYPVKNSTFRDWQMKHRQGGDFIIYSDCVHMRLKNPITVYYK